MSEHGSTDATPLDEGGEHTGKGVVRIATVAALGGFLFGYDSAVINGAVSAVEDHFEADSTSLGFAVASALLGAAADGRHARAPWKPEVVTPRHTLRIHPDEVSVGCSS